MCFFGGSGRCSFLKLNCTTVFPASFLFRVQIDQHYCFFQPKLLTGSCWPHYFSVKVWCGVSTNFFRQTILILLLYNLYKLFLVQDILNMTDFLIAGRSSHACYNFSCHRRRRSAPNGDGGGGSRQENLPVGGERRVSFLLRGETEEEGGLCRAVT